MTSHYLEFHPAIIEKRQVYRLLTGAVGAAADRLGIDVKQERRH
jgi:hypothetical protein